MADHWRAEPQTIGGSTGLVYCIRCGHLLDSDDKGPTKRASTACEPVQIGYR